MKYFCHYLRKKHYRKSNISVRSVRAGKFSSGKKRRYQETCLEHGLICEM
jgi:hypothetical protein